MSESLAYDGLKFDKNFILEEILNTLHDSNLGYFIEVDLSSSDNIKKIRIFFFFRKQHWSSGYFW